MALTGPERSVVRPQRADTYQDGDAVRGGQSLMLCGGTARPAPASADWPAEGTGNKKWSCKGCAADTTRKARRQAADAHKASLRHWAAAQGRI